MIEDTSLSGVRRDHVGLIGRYSMRFSMRTGGGLMTIMVVLLTGLIVASVFITPIEAVMQSAEGLGHTKGEAASQMDEIARSRQVIGAVEWVTGAEESEVSYLLRDQPALLSAIFIALLMAFPFIACLGAFNQTAGDIGSRGLRYLLLRTERPNIFLGRFVGAVGYLAISLAILVFLLVAYIGFKFNIYSFVSITSWGLQGYLALLLLCLPYIAMCAWMSGQLDSPFGSLSICLLLAGFPILFLKLFNAAAGGNMGSIERILPWGWKYELLSGNVGTRLLAYLAMLGFTAFFLALGLRGFRRRDL